jgi:hypothetical protein
MKFVRSTENFADQLAPPGHNGIPEEVRGYIAAQHYPRAWRWRHNALSATCLLLMFAFPTLLGVLLFRLTAVLQARRTELGYFSAENHGYGLVIMLFGVLLASMGAMLVSPHLFGERFAEYAVVRNIALRVTPGGQAALEAAGDNGALAVGFASWLYRRVQARVSGADPRRFLLAHRTVVARWWFVAAAVLIALGLALSWVDFAAYSLATDRGVELHSVHGESLIPWSALQRVRVGCYPPLYVLEFNDGQTVDALFHPTARAVERLLPLDTSLRARGVPVEWRVYTGGTNAGKLAWQPGCFERLSTWLGVDLGTVKRVFTPNGEEPSSR